MGPLDLRDDGIVHRQIQRSPSRATATRAAPTAPLPFQAAERRAKAPGRVAGSSSSARSRRATRVDGGSGGSSPPSGPTGHPILAHREGRVALTSSATCSGVTAPRPLITGRKRRPAVPDNVDPWKTVTDSFGGLHGRARGPRPLPLLPRRRRRDARALGVSLDARRAGELVAVAGRPARASRRCSPVSPGSTNPTAAP